MRDCDLTKRDDLCRPWTEFSQQACGLQFAHLKVLILQPRQPPARYALYRAIHLSYSAFCSRLRSMPHAPTRSWALLPPWEHSRPIYQEGDLALQGWRDRLDGGEGCWKIDEK